MVVSKKLGENMKKNVIYEIEIGFIQGNKEKIEFILKEDEEDILSSIDDRLKIFLETSINPVKLIVDTPDGNVKTFIFKPNNVQFVSFVEKKKEEEDNIIYDEEK